MVTLSVEGRGPPLFHLTANATPDRSRGLRHNLSRPPPAVFASKGRGAGIMQAAPTTRPANAAHDPYVEVRHAIIARTEPPQFSRERILMVLNLLKLPSLGDSQPRARRYAQAVGMTHMTHMTHFPI